MRMFDAALGSLLLLVQPCDEEPATGVVALDYSPFCEFFIVATDRGFSLLHWEGGLYVFAEGDQVRGPLHSLGVQQFEFNEHDPMKARVEAFGASLADARRAFYTRCLDGNDRLPGGGASAGHK
jgi:hypothetical protein